MWMDLDFADQVIEVKRAYVWAQFKVPKSKASKGPVPMHLVLVGLPNGVEGEDSLCKGWRLCLPELPA